MNNDSIKYTIGGLVLGAGLYAGVQYVRNRSNSGGSSSSSDASHSRPGSATSTSPTSPTLSNSSNGSNVGSPSSGGAARRLRRESQDDMPEREQRKGDKPVVVWVDGVFDMMHFGHANMLRQAKALGDKLIVGVNSDESVMKEKGFLPVMNEAERIIAVQGCKWTDEVVPAVPYVMDAEYIRYITEKYKIDIFVHGDDPCLDANGNDVYSEVKRQGKFRTVKRTEGISSTEMVGRMLLMTKDHLKGDAKQMVEGETQEEPRFKSSEASVSTLRQSASVHFFPTTRRLAQFGGSKQPKPGDRIVYVDGSWDLFHAGHILMLKKCREFGDFVLVGICSDEDINRARGGNWPIMNLHERTLCVLSCRYVDEVIIGAPWHVTRDLLVTFNVSLVVHGTLGDSSMKSQHGDDDPYRVPKEMGIFKEIESPSALKADEIVVRILKQRERYEKRHSSKAEKEKKYQQEKTYVAEL